MPSTTLADQRGFVFQFPSLGLADPAGEWVTLRAAAGTKTECAALLAAAKAADAPFQPPKSTYSVIEVDCQGAIWYLPTSHSQKDDSKPELFSVKVRRVLASAVPKNKDRTKLSNSATEAIFFNKSTGKIEYATLPESKAATFSSSLYVSLTTPTGSHPSDAITLEGLDQWRRCLNPTPAQCAPPQRPTNPAARAEWVQKKKRIQDDASKLWQARANDAYNHEWAKEVCQEAGRKIKWEGTIELGGMRVSPEEDWDIRGLDYSLSKSLEAKEEDWRPLPLHAADQEWVRCGVNLNRSALGLRLFMKEEWPPRPTTMMLKYGKKKT